MIDSTFTAIILIGYLILFFSVHGYMDIQMFRSQKSRKSPARNKYTIPLWGQILGYIPSLIFWITFFFGPLLLYSGYYQRIFAPVLMKWSHENTLQVAGLILVLAGVVLADWGRISRGVVAPSWSMPEGYTLCTRGAYKLVRHPMYVSYAFFFVGLPLALLNLLLFVLIAGIAGYYGIAREEERILLKKFGEDYKEYQKKVGMFIPKMG